MRRIMSEREIGPVYGVQLIDSLPLDGGSGRRK